MLFCKSEHDSLLCFFLTLFVELSFDVPGCKVSMLLVPMWPSETCWLFLIIRTVYLCFLWHFLKFKCTILCLFLLWESWFYSSLKNCSVKLLRPHRQENRFLEWTWNTRETRNPHTHITTCPGMNFWRNNKNDEFEGDTWTVGKCLTAQLWCEKQTSFNWAASCPQRPTRKDFLFQMTNTFILIIQVVLYPSQRWKVQKWSKRA